MEDINKYADIMLQQISKIIDDKLKNVATIKTAIVQSVNQNGTVNVVIPPDMGTTFNNIPNQTPFSLQEGDGVELLLKNGNFSNCWIVAKHNATFTGK